MTRIGAAFFLSALIGCSQQSQPQKVLIPSSLDGSSQPALLYIPKQAETVESPLLVHLHSWSAHYDSSDGLAVATEQARARGWVFIAPEFRGPNNNPDAAASKLAIQDVLDAVEFAAKRAKVDRRRIYLLGGSGGGHMALVMAAVAPRQWAAVSAWVPISDLAAWHSFSKQKGARYAEMMESVCGGTPQQKPECYQQRSSLPRLVQAKGLRISIETGIHDGHTGSVPVSQSLEAFNALAHANGHSGKALAARDIASITETETIPSHLAKEVESEEGRKCAILFRRTAGPVRVTIFEGGHETDFATASHCLFKKLKKDFPDIV